MSSKLMAEAIAAMRAKWEKEKGAAARAVLSDLKVLELCLESRTKSKVENGKNRSKKGEK